MGRGVTRRGRHGWQGVHALRVRLHPWRVRRTCEGVNFVGYRILPDHVRVRRSTVNNGDALGECVKGVFSSMKFPSAKNGMTTTPNIGFPFGRM
jgi:hypothetical protein